MNQCKLSKIRRIVDSSVFFQIRNEHVLLGDISRNTQRTAGQGCLGRLKDFFKRHGKLYSFLTATLTSVRISNQFKRELDFVLQRYGENSVILNIGSGPSRIKNRNDIINVDIFAFDAVDVCIGPGPLPFKNDSIDLLISIATLEHISDPIAIVHEFRRVLKDGGEMLLYIPFMQPFHAAPSDFQRWTEEGCKILCSDFPHVSSGIGAGPTSGFLWIGCEWLALILSFGNTTCHSLLSLLFMVITCPLKYLDALFERNPNAKYIASAFYVLAKK